MYQEVAKQVLKRIALEEELLQGYTIAPTKIKEPLTYEYRTFSEPSQFIRPITITEETASSKEQESRNTFTRKQEHGFHFTF